VGLRAGSSMVSAQRLHARPTDGTSFCWGAKSNTAARHHSLQPQLRKSCGADLRDLDRSRGQRARSVAGKLTFHGRTLGLEHSKVNMGRIGLSLVF